MNGELALPKEQKRSCPQRTGFAIPTWLLDRVQWLWFRLDGILGLAQWSSIFLSWLAPKKVFITANRWESKAWTCTDRVSPTHHIVIYLGSYHFVLFLFLSFGSSCVLQVLVQHTHLGLVILVQLDRRLITAFAFMKLEPWCTRRYLSRITKHTVNCFVTL